jgi:hypothetical protein
LEKLHHLGDAVVVASQTTDDDVVLRVATGAQHRAALLGPHAETSGVA